MLEFIFFDTELRDRFIAAMDERQLRHEMRDDHFGWVVGVEECELAEGLVLEIEALYEALQEEQMRRTETAEGGLEKHAAGIAVELPDGASTMVSIPPELASRLLAHFSFEEIHQMFSRVAAAALHPDDRPICQREQ
ncbi:MAG: hypothetical protein M0T86_08555 [Betaproteobacteria bacterium]|nr:hypothetical protein [Betaproteobacteria bacterium]